jgi:choline dehydrogenase
LARNTTGATKTRRARTSPIALLSGIGPQADLQQLGIDTVINLPGVGRNLQDHILLSGLCFEAKRPLFEPHTSFIGGVIFWKSRSELGVPDLMFMSPKVPDASDAVRDQYAIPPNALTILPALVRVQSRGFCR